MDITDIKTLAEKLNAKIKNNILILSQKYYDKSTETYDETVPVFLPLLRAFSEYQFTLNNPTISTTSDYSSLIITATLGFSILKGNYNASISVQQNPQISEKRFNINMTAADSVTKGKMSKIFGKTFPAYIPDYSSSNAVVNRIYQKVFDDIVINNITIHYVDGNKNPDFSCSAAFPDSGVWAKNSFLKLFSVVVQTAKLHGVLLFTAMSNSMNSVFFKLNLDLINTEQNALSLPANNEFSANFFLILESGVNEGSDTLTGSFEYHPLVGKISLGAKFNASGLSDDIVLIGDLFHSENIYNLSVNFGTGLSIADIINVIANFFGFTSDQSTKMLIPKNTVLDYFVLKYIAFQFTQSGAKNELKLSSVLANVATSREWQLPLKYVTINAASVEFSIQWGDIYNAALKSTIKSYYLTADLYAKLTIKLPGGYDAVLSATATFPDIDFEGEMVLNRSISDVIDANTSETLPSKTVNVAKIYVRGSYAKRTLFFQASVSDVLSFTLGKSLTVSLKRIQVTANFLPAGNSYGLSGIIGFGTAAETDYFELSLSAGYEQAKNIWTFQGGLNKGTVSVKSLLNKIVGIDTGGFDIALTAFSIKYQYQKGRVVNPFALFAAFTVDGTFKDLKILPDIDLNAQGSVAISTAPTGDLILSAVVSLKINDFFIKAQADDIGTKHPSYFFTILYKERGLKASYYTKTVKTKTGEQEITEVHKIITAQLVNVTLGDIVEFLISAVNPNFKSTLPPPFDCLYKIDLSKILLEYDIISDANGNKKREEFGISYPINLNLLIFEIKSLKLTYRKTVASLNYYKSGDEGDGVFISLETNLPTNALSDSNSNWQGWDLLKGRVPSFGGKSAVDLDVRFLGLFVHYADAEGKILTQNSIVQATDFIETTDISTPGKNVNFVFATHIVLNDVLTLKLALVDPSIYGLYIGIDANASKEPFKQFKGFYMELLYKRISDKLGMFKATVNVPDKFKKFNFGAVSVTLGLLSAEIYTDGSFLIDLGFPHNNDFTRSFVIEFGVFTARGGVYFGILSGNACPELPKQNGGVWAPVIKLGLGVTFGLGRSFDLGIVKGGVELSMLGIFEGILAVWNADKDTQVNGNNDVYYKISATVGLIGKLYISVDLVLITLEASVGINATAKAAIETGKPIIIDLDLSLTLYGSVKILFVRIKFSYDFSYHVQFKIDNNDKLSSNNDYLSLFEDREVFTTKKIFAEKIAVNWFIVTAFTTDKSNNPKIVFVPATKDFDNILQLCVNWCLTKLVPDRKKPGAAENKYISKDAAMQLTSGMVKYELTYLILQAFLRNNATFTLINITSNNEFDGAVLPMLPEDFAENNGKDTVLSYNDKTVNFNTDFAVSDGYQKQIDDFFANIIDNNLTAAEEGKTSIAQVLFTNYFCMIASQAFIEIRGLYNNYHIQANDFSVIKDKYAVEFEDIASQNMDLQLTNAPLSLTVNYVVPEITSIASILEKFGGSTPVTNYRNCDAFSDISDKCVLTNTVIDVDQFEFENDNNFRMSLEFITSMFYARFYGENITGYYQKYIQTIISVTNTGDINQEFTDKQKITVSLFGDTIEYFINIGDTPELIAKTCAVLINGTTCVENEKHYTDFVKEIKDLNVDFETATSAVIKATNVKVYSCETFRQLTHRLFASDDESKLYSKNIIAKFARLTLTNAFLIPIDGQTLLDFVKANPNIESTDIYSALKKANIKLPILTINPNQIEKQEIIDYLTQGANFAVISKRITAITSRILLQGLRLPRENPHSSEDPTAALYEISGLQMGYEKDTKIYSVNGTEFNIPDKPVTSTKPKLEEAFTITQLSPFEESTNVYGLAEKYKYNTNILRLLPKNFTLFNGAKLTVNGVNTAYEPILYLPFTMTKTSDTIYSVSGMSASDRIKLSTIVQAVSGYQTFEYEVVYFPSGLSGLTETLLCANFDAKDKFIKNNLSRITKLEANANVLKDIITIDMVSDLTTSNFLLMLWECAVTCGKYTLSVDETHKLPFDIFDKNGNATLYVKIKLTLDFIADANAVLTNDLPNFTAAAYFTGNDDDKTQQSMFSQPYYYIQAQTGKQLASYNTSAGCYGFEVKYTPPTENNLYNIVSYQITAYDNVEKTIRYVGNISKPLIAVNEKKNDIDDVKYLPVVAPYNILDKNSPAYNPYHQFNSIDITFSCRDVFGNEMNETKTVDVNLGYSDFIVGVGEWANVTCSYTFNADHTACVTIRNTEILKDNVSVEPLQRAIWQLSDTNTKVEIHSELLTESIVRDKSAFITFISSIIEKEKATDITISDIVIDYNKIDRNSAITEVDFEIVIARDTDDKGKVKESSTKLIPDLMTKDADGNLIFVKNFEKDEYKLAYKNQNSSSIYAINTKALFGELTVTQNNDFYAIAPLTTSPITRTISFDSATSTSVNNYRSSQSETISFTDIDINLWARQFLEDFEQQIISNLQFVTKCSNDNIIKLLSAKENLAESISETLQPLKAGGPVVSQSIKNYAKDILRARLDEIISSIEMFGVGGFNDNGVRLSLSTQCSDKIKENTRVNATTSKISKDISGENINFGVFYNAVSKYETGFTPTFETVKIREFEKSVSELYNGYETSDWYQFIIPYDSKFDITPKIPVPNSLNEIPQAPQLSDSKFSPPDILSNKHLYETEYSFNVTTPAVEQDEINIRIAFQEVSQKLKEERKDLFYYLACYQRQRANILSKVEKLDTSFVDDFINLINNIAGKWGVINKVIQKTASNEYTATVKLNIKEKELKSDNPDFEFEIITSDIVANKPYTFSVKVKNPLSVYDINSAIPYVKIKRNSDLVTNVSAKFIFTTEEKSLPEVFAINTFNVATLGSVNLPWSSGISSALNMLSQSVGNTTTQNYRIELTASYNYGFENTNTIVKLPVAMQKNVFNSLSVDKLNQIISDWYTKTNPSTILSSLSFNLKIYRGDKLVISADKLTIDGK